jgi:hypothetical protein
MYKKERNLFFSCRSKSSANSITNWDQTTCLPSCSIPCPLPSQGLHKFSFWNTTDTVSESNSLETRRRPRSRAHGSIKIQEVLHLKQHTIPHILTPNRESDNTSLKRSLNNQTRRYPNRTETTECQPPNVPRNPKE